MESSHHGGSATSAPAQDTQEKQLQDSPQETASGSIVRSHVDTKGDQAVNDNMSIHNAGPVHREQLQPISTAQPGPPLYPSIARTELPSSIAGPQTGKHTILKKKRFTKSARLIKAAYKARVEYQLSELSTPGSTPAARDQSRPLPPKRLSLAATHPSNYRQQYTPRPTPKQPPATPPPHLPRRSSFEKFMNSLLLSPEASKFPPHPLSPTGVSTSELPWRTNFDPMHQTSTDPHEWERNCMTMRADMCMEVGNVISPTFMVGLPCGGMVEIANYYGPSSGAEGEGEGEGV